MHDMLKPLFRRVAFIGVVFAAVTLTASPSVADGFLNKVKGLFVKGGEAPAKIEASSEPSAVPMEKIRPAQKKNADEPTFDFSDKKIGSDDAPLKLTVFTSLTCGHCAHFHTSMLPKIVSTYVNDGRMQVILADFPLESRAMTASQVAHCFTGDEYFKIMDTLYAKQNQWMMAENLQDALSEFTRPAGMSDAKMLACATDEMAQKTIARKRNIYIMKYRINATPTLYLQKGKKGEKIEGMPDWSEFEEKVAAFGVAAVKPAAKAPAGAP